MELAVGASGATIKSLLTKLGGLLADEYALIRGVRGDIQFINDELASMQAFLSNLSAGGTDGHDDQTVDWMKQVREVSFDIEDCVDDFSHGLRPDPRSSSWLSTVRGVLYEIQTASLRRSIAVQVAELKQRAQNVGERRGRYGVRDPKNSKKKSSSSGATGYLAAEHQATTRQLISIKEPVGVKDLGRLEKWIGYDDGKKQLGVLYIVGFGGVGKTTIAKSLYRNFGDQFQHRAMVTVSQNSEPDEVLMNIISQVKPQAGSEEHQGHCSPDTLSGDKSILKSILSRILSPARNQQEENQKHEGIQTELQNYLNTKRYLLLIDDVWSSPTWQIIKKYFPRNDKGSRIIVTTRFQAVATACYTREDADYLYPINVLSGDESEKLFKDSLLECKHTAANQPSESNVPKRVWEMCGGLPLAIVRMAGLVASKPLSTETAWTDVCNSLFPEPEKCRKPEDFMRIINYCYSDLPSDLKTCSLYLSIFPKGRKFSRKRLIRRWIAEGFVSEKQGLSVEDVAETCFNQLIERKIIRPVEHSSDGRVKTCQVHDMILEYIMSKAGEEDFVTVVGGYWSMTTRSNKVRRLSLHNSDSKHAKKADSMNLSHVRSLTVFGSLEQLRFKSFKARIVQVLDLEGCRGFKASHVSVSDICEMTLLKYLSLRATDISKLPSNIGNLKYLETLDVRQTEIQELPKSISQLERINNILGGDKRTRKTLKLPKDVKGTMKGQLSGIEIIEGSTAASDLRHFTRLRKLAIYKLHKDVKMFEELLSSIQYLSGYSLQSLIIDDESSDFLNTLDSMTSHPLDLRSLELSGKLMKIPEWLPRLSELIKLTLSATALRTDNLALLSKLDSLFSLTFSISDANKDPDMATILEKNKSDSRGEIFFPDGGFIKLKLLRVFVPLLPSLNFSEKGTPLLGRLELRFKRLEGVHGMDKLKKLQDVILTVDDKASELTKTMVDDLKKSSSSNTSSKKYTLIVNEYHS
ncbi:Disease resistance protein RPP13 [Triticum urartu]|uniref:Disease resistance protein RPP13 n=2 Tax=Triticum urartu TaxID=4572 RepID=M8B4C5_TRIUA|nr:disease resistance protein Pik-2-like [Triticum urartu]EMS68464.1 Disease resistance protein RPP13 [Triticum urartu]